MSSLKKVAAIGLIATSLLGAVVSYFFYFRRRRMSFFIGQTYSLLKSQQKIMDATIVESEIDAAPAPTPTPTTSTRRPLEISSAEIKQLFFAQEVHLGEQEFARGNLPGGAKHFALAVVVYEQPDSFIKILQQILPAPVFMMVMQEVDVIRREIARGREGTEEEQSSSGAIGADSHGNNNAFSMSVEARR